MAAIQAAMMKVNHVLDIARKDQRFFNDLSRDPVRTLQESGIDLSPGEILATIDIVRGTSNSTLAPLLEKSRKLWGNINKDAALGSTTAPSKGGGTKKGKK